MKFLVKLLKTSLILTLFLNSLGWAAKVVLTGDSTVATYPSSSPKQGWGSAISKYFVNGSKVINLARGGTSSKTFISEGDWKKAVAQKGNFVLIQFGHNDQGKKHTSPDTSYKANLRKMIKEVKAYGGTPVIISSPRRLKFENSNRMSSELGPYAVAAREVAAEEKVPFVNLYERSKQVYLQMGEKKSLSYFAKNDRTHTNSKGADLLASLVASELAQDPAFKNLIK